MKTENMKLLDLQTGKYLELGNDWLYGGNAIHISNPKSVGYYCFTQKPHTNPIINQIAEKVGAVIYGGRYVLLENAIYKNKNITMGDTMEIDTTGIAVKSMILMINMCIFDDDFCSELNIDTLLQSKHIGNIFEEFAKKEQGLENKFDELNNLI